VDPQYPYVEQQLPNLEPTQVALEKFGPQWPSLDIGFVGVGVDGGVEVGLATGLGILVLDWLVLGLADSVGVGLDGPVGLSWFQVMTGWRQYVKPARRFELHVVAEPSEGLTAMKRSEGVFESTRIRWHVSPTLAVYKYPHLVVVPGASAAPAGSGIISEAYPFPLPPGPLTPPLELLEGGRVNAPPGDETHMVDPQLEKKTHELALFLPSSRL
jgi:hypothetical protein